MNENWEPYDPEWLVDLAKEQLPDRPEIILALSSCIRAKHSGKAYIYFVSSDSPNQPGSEWQFKENIRLEHKEHGTIVLDILRDNKIGGLEILKHLR